ncbi:hypothetical protein ACQKCU_25090 [Heyndrickxia sporothermodurans]
MSNIFTVVFNEQSNTYSIVPIEFNKSKAIRTIFSFSRTFLGGILSKTCSIILPLVEEQ